MPQQGYLSSMALAKEDTLRPLGSRVAEKEEIRETLAEITAPIDKGKPQSEFVADGLGWFIKVFASYDADGILNEKGHALLNHARLTQSDILGEDLCSELYRVIKYFCSIPEMTREEIIEQFPEEYFKKVTIPEIPESSPVRLKLIDNCNGCTFCPVQKGGPIKSIAYPLLIMLAKENPARYISGGLFEPLLYEDPCGASYHDAAKLFGVYVFITHGYIDKNSAVALRSIERINSSGVKYNITITIDATDLDYFRLRAAAKSDSDIIRHYVGRYYDLIKRLSIDNIYEVRFMLSPGETCSDDNEVTVWNEILDKIMEKLLKKNDIKLFDASDDEQSRKAKNESIPCIRYQMSVLSERGYGYVHSRRYLAWLKALGGGGFGYEIMHYIDPYGILNIMLTPNFQNIDRLRDMFTRDELKEYIKSQFIVDDGYRKALMNLSSLKVPWQPELHQLILDFSKAYGQKRTDIAEEIAERLVDLPFPVSVKSEIEHEDFVGRMLELNNAPEFMNIPLVHLLKPDTSVDTDRLPPSADTMSHRHEIERRIQGAV